VSYYKSTQGSTPITKSQQQLQQLKQQLEANGLNPTITRLPSTAKRNHKMLLRGQHTTM